MNKQKIQKYPTVSSTWFTLVELIVTIVILWILASISWITLMSYFSSARDVVRSSDINSISKALVLYQTKVGDFPEPTDAKSVTYWSGEIWKQWTIGATVLHALTMNRIPLDPKFDAEYSYSVTQDKKSYQIAGVAETDEISYRLRTPSVDKAYAETYTAYIKGNYNGMVAKAVGDGYCKVIALPSITLSELPSGSSVDLLSTWSGKLAFMKKENLPASYIGKLPSGVELANRFPFRDYADGWGEIAFPCDIIGSQVISQEELQKKLNTLVTELGSFYETTSMANDQSYTAIVNTKWWQAIDKVILWESIVNNYLGGKITVDKNNIQSYYCGVKPVVNNVEPASWRDWTPQDFSQLWEYSPTPGNCTFSCLSGYAYNSTSGNCELDVCKGDLSLLNGVMIEWSTQNMSTTWTYSVAPGICKYTCAEGYLWNWSVCMPKNCDAQTLIINSKEYSIPSITHGSVQTVASNPLAIVGGTLSYNAQFQCNKWVITQNIWTELANTPVCTMHYSANWLVCDPETKTFICNTGSKPLHSVWNTVSWYGQIWNGTVFFPIDTNPAYSTTASTNTCRYKCDLAYHTEDTGVSCISDSKSCTIVNWTGLQTWNGSAWGVCTVQSCNSWYVEQSNACIPDVCVWNPPVNTISNAISQSSTKTWVYNTTAGQCTFTCDTNYLWNGSACVAATQTYTCATKPTNSSWNTVGSYLQTWNGSAWLPSNSLTSYNLTASSTTCRYQCSSGYHTEDWWSTCISNTKTCAITWASSATQTWNGSSWNSCVALTCNTNYTLWSGTCTANQQGTSCGWSIITNAAATTAISYTQTWNGSIWTPTYSWSYGWSTCGYACNGWFHTENGWISCVSNTRSCSITNWAGSQAWNGSSWGTCTVSSCDSGYYQSWNSCLTTTYSWSYGWWGGCSVTCGWWTQSRSASCIRNYDSATVSNAYCETPVTSQSCNTQACPVNCVGSWSNNANCSATCGGWVYQQTYTITTNAANGGAGCAYSNGATQWWGTSCNTQWCPVNCVGSWSDTSSCSATCGGWVKQQIYTITTNAANGGATCSSTNGATRWGATSCNTQWCPVNCVGSWSNNANCSATCGGWVYQQTYTITTNAANGGAGCAYSNGATQWWGTSCNTQWCPVNCVGSWSDTSSCSATCGGWVKQQIYTITTNAANGGATCSSTNGATRWGATSCNTQSCLVPINGVCGSHTWPDPWCAAGTYQDAMDGDSQWHVFWDCLWIDGWADVWCSGHWR